MFLRKQVLCQKHDANVSVMPVVDKQICHSLVRFLRQVLDNQSSRFAVVKVVQVWHSLMKDDSGIITKQLVVLSVTVNLARRRICHWRYIVC